MTLKSLSAEQISENWDKFCAWLDKTGERADACKALAMHFGERLAMCPASSKLKYHNAFAGGLIDHSLRVLKNAVLLKKTFNWDVSNESLIICSLFHDIGKVGDLEKDYYVEQTSDWHRDKNGEIFTFNENISYMETPDRSVWLLQQFGVKLSRDEWLAIKLNDGYVYEPNRKYCMREGVLAHIIMTADYISTMQEKM